MKIQTVEYSALVNLGNYSNERIGFTAVVTGEETVEQVVEQLRTKAQECALPNLDNVHKDIYQAQKALRELERKLDKARAEWDATAEFLRRQGIKVDAQDMPQFNRLLPAVSEERVDVSDGDLVDDSF